MACHVLLQMSSHVHSRHSTQRTGVTTEPCLEKLWRQNSFFPNTLKSLWRDTDGDLVPGEHFRGSSSLADDDEATICGHAHHDGIVVPIVVHLTIVQRKNDVMPRAAPPET